MPHYLASAVSVPVSISVAVTPYDLHMSGGDTLAADLVIRSVKPLHTARVEVKVAVVALHDLSQLCVRHFVSPFLIVRVCIIGRTPHRRARLAITAYVR